MYCMGLGAAVLNLLKNTTPMQHGQALVRPPILDQARWAQDVGGVHKSVPSVASIAGDWTPRS